MVTTCIGSYSKTAVRFPNCDGVLFVNVSFFVLKSVDQNFVIAFILRPAHRSWLKFQIKSSSHPIHSPPGSTLVAWCQVYADDRSWNRRRHHLENLKLCNSEEYRAYCWRGGNEMLFAVPYPIARCSLQVRSIVKSSENPTSQSHQISG